MKQDTRLQKVLQTSIESNNTDLNAKLSAAEETNVHQKLNLETKWLENLKNESNLEY